jgi:hypothetical protein
VRRALILGLVLACGGKPVPKPPPPPELEPKTLARQLDDDMNQLAALAKLHRDDCTALATALRPHVDQMKRHAGEVARMLEDPTKARQLESELATYANATPARTDQIANDLGATYRSCQNDPAARHQLERAIADIPTY